MTDNWRKYLSTISCAVLIISVVMVWWRPSLDASHGGTHMLLLWDGGAAPTGWTDVSATHATRFIRGDTVANVLGTGGAATHNHTLTSVTLGALTGQRASSGIINGRPNQSHTHGTPSGSLGVANNLPVYRDLQLIRCDIGMCNVIPQNAIALFDDTPSALPAGWSAYSAQNGNMIRVNSTAGGTGGNDAPTHNITWNALPGASSTNSNSATSGGQVASSAGHTHTAPAATPTSATPLPPYVEPRIAQVSSATTAIPPGMIAFFDAEPGAGWSKKSESGGVFNTQFLRPAATYNATSQGSASHNHGATVNSGASGGPSGTNTGGAAGTGIASNVHTHVLRANLDAANVSHLPTYTNFVIAEKISFAQTNYRWYVDSDAENVTNPWGNPDIAQNTQITPLPTSNAPPVPVNELRLRTNFTVSAADLPVTSIQFKLQYKKGTDASCTTGSWTDVGASGGGVVWRFAASSVTDGANLSATQLSPASDVMQDYVKASPSVTNANLVDSDPTAKTTEYDFHIEHNGAVDASQYSFRVVESNGVLFSSYTVCPTLVTAPGTANLLRHGNFFQDESEKGFYWAN